MQTLTPFSPSKNSTPQILADARLNEEYIELEFRIGSAKKLKGLPPKFSELQTAAERADGLWESTCFEAFWCFSDRTGEPYWEFNLAPDGRWNLYAFHGYRKRNQNWKPEFAPEIESSNEGEETVIRARFPFGNTRATRALHFGLSAVLEFEDGEKSHLALKHMGKEADFHDKRSFSLVIETA